ncbi:MAG: pyridoxamine 5'-phosphate oxidase [Flavobacteriales bacterium]|nr:pyridoxamine 5'-phosphate oxidase [Flavobacteriales bacterium]
MKNIHSIRTDYVKREMRIQDLADSPAQQLSIWISEAIKSNVPDANAFCLSTVTSDGFPKGRMVLVRAIEGESVDFYTNKNSHKGKDLRSNAKAGATFFWAEMERQVCLTGVVTEISEEENDLYFDTRPRESQLSAWVSDQSSPIDSRDQLTKSYAEVKARFDGVEKVERPPHWGGYRITFERVEFWQGRASRLHDRVVYTKSESGAWVKGMLQP